MKTKTIYVYRDEGVSELSSLSALRSFKKHCNDYQVFPIMSNDIINGVLNPLDCLVMPGGADLPYCEKLNGNGNQNIKQFVADGGTYIGICAGAYYATSHIIFTGAEYSLNEARELGLFAGTATGSIAKLTDGHLFGENTKSKVLTPLTLNNDTQLNYYYHGGPYFHDAVPEHVIARYQTGENAIIAGTYGKGRYLLSGVHFEICPDTYREIVFNDLSADDEAIENSLLGQLKNTDCGQAIYTEIGKLL